MRCFQLPKGRIYIGDCLKVMASMDADSVDSIVTDPPYGLSFMGKDWDHGIPGKHFWIEALRVAKPGAYLLAFGGTRTFHRRACAIEDAGWEIRDCIMWVYGSGFPKGKNVCLKPAWEPIVLAKKPTASSIKSTMETYGTGCLQIDMCRVPLTGEQSTSEARRKSTFGGRKDERAVDSTFAGKINRRGSSEVYAADHGGDKGRWPANLIHDGSDEVLSLFPANAGASGRASGPTRGKLGTQGRWGPASGNMGESVFYGDAGSAARFFYCAKASKADRDEGLVLAPDRLLAMSNQAKAELRRGHGKTGSRLGINDIKVRKNNHPTVKPTSLVRYLCRLVTPPNGTILDPFFGSGSTGKAAMMEGFRIIGIEISKEYAKSARARVLAATPKAKLTLPRKRR